VEGLLSLDREASSTELCRVRYHGIQLCGVWSCCPSSVICSSLEFHSLENTYVSNFSPWEKRLCVWCVIRLCCKFKVMLRLV
jgi:hypothetical protein